MATIAIPPIAKENLKALNAEISSAQRAINAIVVTLREANNVPSTWTLTDFDKGFVAPEEPAHE
jgi:hypothetical protein